MSDPGKARDSDGRDSNPTDEGDAVGAGECAPGSPARNSSWHGLHVSGTIAALTGNGIGIAGIASGSRIIPVRALGACGGSSIDVADAIRWSAGLPVSGMATNANPAKVINMSLGGPGTCDSYTQNAINAARGAGAVIVTAAGNENTNAASSSPGNCQGVINVAATDQNGARASFSNYGDTVTLAAPGTMIYSTYNSGTTTPNPSGMIIAAQQGTSMAAPHVAGVAALVMGTNPSLTPDQVAGVLSSHVNPFPSGCSGCGVGIVNAAKAVAGAAEGDVGLSISPRSGKLAGGDTVTVTGLDLALTSEVLFGSRKAKITAKSPTSVTVKAPKGAAGQVDVTIKGPKGTKTANSQYLYAAVPAVKKYAPKLLTPDGGQLVISGTGFGSDATVTFNGVSVPVASVSATELTVIAPANTTNSKAVVPVVVTSNGLVSKASKFTYAVPKVRMKTTTKSIAPAGETVTFTGNDFEKVSSIAVNGETLSVDEWSYVAADKSLSVKVPALGFKAKPTAQIVATTKWNGPSNKVNVKYAVPKTTLKAPRVALTPDGGVAAFTGTNLDQITSVKVAGVEVAAGEGGWSLDAAKTTLSVPIPAQSATTKSVPVIVASPYIELRPVAAKIAVPKPRIASSTTSVATAGGSVTVTGAGLDTISTVTVGTTTLASEAWTVAADGASITVTVPARASGAKAATTIVVTNKWSVKSNAVKLTYAA